MDMEEINLFYATENRSKLHNMVYRLRDYPIRVICPEDQNLHITIEENGKTAVENAILKASRYYEAVKMPTIAGDTGMTISGISEEDQPGLYVRRVHGRVLSDDEMIDYYADLAAKAEGPCYLHYFTGIALITGDGTFTMELKEIPLRLSPVPNKNRKHWGNPLDVITLLEDGRYINDLSDEERTALGKAGEDAFTEFIVNHLL